MLLKVFMVMFMFSHKEMLKCRGSQPFFCSCALWTFKRKETHRQWCSFDPLIFIFWNLYGLPEKIIERDCFMQGGHFCLAHCCDFKMHKNA